MNILVTNDDGILAPGIISLVEQLQKEVDKVTVIAPDRNKSGVSSSISLEVPLRLTKVRENWYQLNGTPADCVKLALSGFLNQEPDMVISGINVGQNLGDDVIYSGTVGGAIEGRFLRMPSIAVSCIGLTGKLYFDTAAKVVCDLLKRLKKNPLQSGLILNVNVPNLPYDQLKGIQITRQGDRAFSEPMMLTEDGRGKPIYWLGEVGKVVDGGEGTDFHALSQDYVAVTPMSVDMTSHKSLNYLQHWINN